MGAFIFEIVLVCAGGVLVKRALETPSVLFGDCLSIWDIVAAAMAAKMNSLSRHFSLRRWFRYNRDGELHEETAQHQEMVFASSTSMRSSIGGHTYMWQVPANLWQLALSSWRC